jgi:hypothetical protein
MIDNKLISELEEERVSLYNVYQKKLIFFICKLIVSPIIIIIGVSLPHILYKVFTIILGSALLISGIVIFILNHLKKGPLIAKIKDSTILDLVNMLYENGDYQRNEGISESIIENTKTQIKADVFSSTDLVSGKYKNVEFVSSDVKIEVYETHAGTNGTTTTTLETKFLGRWIIFSLKTNFHKTLKILESNYGSINKGLVRVKTESVIFNKKFYIFSTDPEFLFYIITPKMIEIFLKIESLFGGYITFCIIDDKFHIGINNYKDNLEYKINKPIEEQINALIKELSLYIDLIDLLELSSNKFGYESN